MTDTEKILLLSNVLHQVHDMALESARCDIEIYEESKNGFKAAMDQLIEIGGDVCDWTMLAIITRDALAGTKS